jgi:hypothetical protein
MTELGINLFMAAITRPRLSESRRSLPNYPQFNLPWEFMIIPPGYGGFFARCIRHARASAALNAPITPAALARAVFDPFG